jgi:hypothetical protein
MQNKRVRAGSLFIALLIFVSMSACAPEISKTRSTPTPEGIYLVDPLFREFYDLLGGERLLGPAISPIFQSEDKKFQYTVAASLEYDPGAPPNERFRLSSIGLELGIEEPSVPAPERLDQFYEDGFIIFDVFVPFYRKMGGDRFVGSPISGVHYNSEKRSFEQYFENVGFTWNENDPIDAVYLLAYGAWKCDIHCRYTDVSSMQFIPKRIRAHDELFSPAVSRLGSDFTGAPISEAYRNAEGKIEKVYENVVLLVDGDRPFLVELRSLPEFVGYIPTPPGPASDFPGMNFWPVDGDLGYNIPQDFMDYIAMHGGFEISGPPLGELALKDSQTFIQCFKNLCLEYTMNMNLPPPMRIRVSPLGYQYLEIAERPLDQEALAAQWQQALILDIWKRYPTISPSESQEIGLNLFEGSKPVAEAAPFLVLELPDGSRDFLKFAPTNDRGQSNITLPPFSGKNGEIINFHVCIKRQDDDLFCIKDNFVIWQNP